MRPVFKGRDTQINHRSRIEVQAHIERGSERKRGGVCRARAISLNQYNRGIHDIGRDKLQNLDSIQVRLIARCIYL